MRCSLVSCCRAAALPVAELISGVRGLPGAVVLADGWLGAAAEGVEESDGEGVADELANSCLVGPAEGGYLVVGGELATGDLAAKHEGNDAPVHVLVDAAQGVGLDVEPGLLANFAPQPGFDRLIEFEDAAGGLPVVVVAALDEQGLAWSPWS